LPYISKEPYPVFPPKSTRHVLPFRIFGPKVDLNTLNSDEDPKILEQDEREKLKESNPEQIEYWPNGINLDRWYSEPIYIFDPDDIHRISKSKYPHERTSQTVASHRVEDELQSIVDRFFFVPTESLVIHEQTNETDARLICKSIEKEKHWFVPLVVSRQNNKYFVIDGMHRTEAARILDLKILPAINYDYEKDVHLGRWLRILSGWTSKKFHQRLAKLEKDDKVQLMELSEYDLAGRGGFLKVMATDMAVLWIENKQKWSIFVPRTPWQQRYTPLEAYRILLARIDSTFGIDPRTRRSLKGHYAGEDEPPTYLGCKQQIIIFPPVLTNRQLLETMKDALSQ